jgi:hypothetical protein
MDFGDIPAWIALIVSGWTLYKQSRTDNAAQKREQLAHKIARLDAIEAALGEIRTTAAAYWLFPEGTAAKEGLMLLHHLKTLSGECDRNRDLLWADAWRHALDLKMEMTGADFQQQGRPGRPANDPLIRKFTETFTAFSENLRRTRAALTAD